MSAHASPNEGMFVDAAAYERYMGRLSRLIVPQLLDFTDLDDRARYILDVGSGTGSLALAVAARSAQYSVVGIDPSAAYVSYAASCADATRVSFEVGDAQRLRFAAGSFDAALSLLVFNFIPDPARALGELKRVTRPGGVIAAAVWDYGAGMEVLRTFWDTARALDPAAASLDEGNMPLCRAGELTALWQSAGLAAVDERGLEAAADFASFEDYWQPFLLGQGPAGAYVQGLPEERKDRLRAALAERLPRGAFALRARVWAVRGIN